MSAREDDDETQRLTHELARTHEELRMTRLVLARVTVELAQEKAKNLALHHAIEHLT